jgi:hypothetical protein
MQFLHRLPSIELPYENLIHKEVRIKDPLYLLHPYGKRYYAWFTYDKHHSVCYLLELSGKKVIHSTLVTASYHPDLSLGTLLYGTLVYKNNKRCFVIDTIVQDRGVLVKGSYYEKLLRIENVLSNYIDHQIVVSKQLMFMLPEMHTSMDDLDEIRPCYNVYCIKMIPLHGEHKVFNYIKQHKQSSTAVFRVVSCRKGDVYELYVSREVHGYALIDTFVCSVMMNDLFRYIPENHNLDIMEESEDEVEWSPKEHIMEMEWKPSFKKWLPLRVSTKPQTDESMIKKLERS